MRLIFATGLALVSVLGAPAQDLTKLSIDQLRSGIEKQHPLGYYILAGKLFAAGKKDEAVFWFYA
ncbi:MAG: hypothetical protein JO170_03665, partial [Verrucomicrobia bacterium]|nr:hypothetical protein [Verrucomicrobiota bacterium]